MIEMNAPAGGMMCINPASTISEVHNHHETESLFIIRGEGMASSSLGSQKNFSSGDIVIFEPFEKHNVINTSTNNELVYLSLYWADSNAIENALNNDREEFIQKRQAVALITPPPTPNGDLHVGHLSGPYLAADVIKRFYNLCNVPVKYFCGSDDNQSYVATKAVQREMDPRKLAQFYAQSIRKTLTESRFEIDGFLEPSSEPEYAEFVRSFFNTLRTNGAIIEKQVQQPYCSHCDTFVSEAFVTGACPHCESTSDGNGCEACGRPNDCSDLIDPKCKLCGNGTSLKLTNKLYFKLSDSVDQLRAHVLSSTMPGHLLALCLRMLDEGLPDIAVTQHTTWGIETGDPQFADQRIYVWLEMAAGFLYGAQNDAWGIDEIWKNPETKRILLMGFDNSYYYALLVPALFMKFDEAIKPPNVYVVNEFYKLEGAKFSTSRGHAIWGSEFLSRNNADAARLFISSTRPEVEQTNFSMEEFRRYRNDELGKWTRWLVNIDHSSRVHFGGSSVEPGAWTEEQKSFYSTLQGKITFASAHYRPESFSLRSVARILSEIVDMGIEFEKSQIHLASISSCKDTFRTYMALQIAAAKTLATLAFPIAPEFAKQVMNGIGETNLVWRVAPEFVKAGQKVNLRLEYFCPPIQECEVLN